MQSHNDRFAHQLCLLFIFRLTVKDFIFVRRHIASSLQQRPDYRGRPPISTNIVMATALLYLSSGSTFLWTALMIRNGQSVASTMRCVRLFTSAVNTHLKPHLITFPKSYAGLDKCARAFQVKSTPCLFFASITKYTCCGSFLRRAPEFQTSLGLLMARTFEFHRPNICNTVTTTENHSIASSYQQSSTHEGHLCPVT